MTIFLDFDGVIVDSRIAQPCGRNYKESQKLIPKFGVNQTLVEYFREHGTEEVYIVSGNIGSTIKQTIDHFALPFDKDRVMGYQRFMPMDNLKRKIAVIKKALQMFNVNKEDVVYIGDEDDDETACKTVGVAFRRVKPWIV